MWRSRGRAGESWGEVWIEFKACEMSVFDMEKVDEKEKIKQGIFPRILRKISDCPETNTEQRESLGFVICNPSNFQLAILSHASCV